MEAVALTSASAEMSIPKALLVGPRGVAEDAIEVLLVGRLDPAHGVGERAADVLWGRTHVPPVAALGDLEAVLVGVVLSGAGFLGGAASTG
jgi:hypothetical protein